MSNDTTHITVTPSVLYELHAATPPSARKQRQGPGGKMLTYVDARYVQGVLDSEVGPGNWQSEFTIGAGGKVACRIGIRVYFAADERTEWVWKGDGAGETDIEGEKGSFSDAFKRAAVKWGVARDLYGEAPQSTPVNVPQNDPHAAVMDAATRQALAQEDENTPDPLFDTGKCPAHETSWSVQQGGISKATQKPYKAFYKCAGKTPDGKFCPEKPSAEWTAAHPIA